MRKPRLSYAARKTRNQNLFSDFIHGAPIYALLDAYKISLGNLKRFLQSAECRRAIDFYYQFAIAQSQLSSTLCTPSAVQEVAATMTRAPNTVTSLKAATALLAASRSQRAHPEHAKQQMNIALLFANRLVEFQSQLAPSPRPVPSLNSLAPDAGSFEHIQTTPRQITPQTPKNPIPVSITHFSPPNPPLAPPNPDQPPHPADPEQNSL